MAESILPSSIKRGRKTLKTVGNISHHPHVIFVDIYIRVVDTAPFEFVHDVIVHNI
jgi:hypothetical protein